MRISSKYGVLILSACLLSVSPARLYAFDPEKVFAEKDPSMGTILRYFFTARENGNEEDALDALKYAAEHGSQAAQWKLGRMYQIGDGVPKDPRAAYAFFQGIVDNYGNTHPGTPEWQFTSNAMVALGEYYLVGVPEAGIQKDPDKARIMFTTAATYFDNPDAQFKLARLYLDGENTNAEIIQAARLLKTAAEQEHIGAEALLGHLIFEGKYIRRDPVRGLAMMMHASNRATGSDSSWVNDLLEQSFATASEKERRDATERVARLD
jgi:exopolysaccharide production negative regulator